MKFTHSQAGIAIKEIWQNLIKNFNLPLVLTKKKCFQTSY
jgi:hypothetical protein